MFFILFQFSIFFLLHLDHSISAIYTPHIPGKQPGSFVYLTLQGPQEVRSSTRNREFTRMNGKLRRTVLVFALLSVGVLFVFSAPLVQAATTHPAGSSSLYHNFGGFTVDTSAMANAAAGDGISEAHMYGLPTSTSSDLGQTLQSLGMHEVDSYLWDLLYEYECHRSHSTGHGNAYCTVDYPSMNSQSVLLSLVQSHLQQVAGNTLVNAYWVLDDWPAWDYGGAKTLLQLIHRLIQQYTPNRPAICGFGAAFGYHHDDYWNDGVAANFSPQGCDLVGLYIYSTSVPVQANPSSDAFNWSMSTLLPKIFISLSRRGWSMNGEPMIGIGQAFGGTVNGTQNKFITPNSKNIITQALSFCQQGASSVFFYGWDMGTSLGNPQTPMTNSSIEQGIQQGISACKSYWGG
jgi:hypothetical protein